MGQREVLERLEPLEACKRTGQELQSSKRLRYKSLATYFEGLASSYIGIITKLFIDKDNKKEKNLTKLIN